MTQQELIQTLRDADIKPTNQRVMILDYLLKNRNHPSSEQIYADLHKEVSVMSRATIYNTVNIFQEKGLLRVLETGDEYSLYDIEVDDHAHFQCKHCKKIWNIDLVENFHDVIKLPEGFESEDQMIMLHGTCPDCKK